MKKIAFLAVVFFVLVSTARAQFKYVSVDYPGAMKTWVWGINNQGEMVGAYRPSDQPTRHAMLVDNGKFIPLAPKTVLGTSYSEAFKINDWGDIVGNFCDDSCHGFLLHKGQLTILDYPGASNTTAFGINDVGVVVGYWDLADADGNILFVRGFQWKDGLFTFVSYPGTGDITLIANNNLGTTVGIWDAGITSTISHGFVGWKEYFSSFDAPYPDVTFTQADGINDLGIIVGQEYTVDELANDTGHGFLRKNGKFTQLNYPGAMQTTAWGINNLMQMVGNWLDDVNVYHGWFAVPCDKDLPRWAGMLSQRASDAALTPATPNAAVTDSVSPRKQTFPRLE